MIAFTIPGNPLPTARPRVVRVKGRAVAFTPKASRDWQGVVALYARQAMALRAHGVFPVKELVRLRVTFHRDSWRRCDLDNLTKSVLDGLTQAGAWDDDSQVVELHARKAVSQAEPRTEVALQIADPEHVNGWDAEWER